MLFLITSKLNNLLVFFSFFFSVRETEVCIEISKTALPDRDTALYKRTLRFARINITSSFLVIAQILGTFKRIDSSFITLPRPGRILLKC